LAEVLFAELSPEALDPESPGAPAAGPPSPEVAFESDADPAFSDDVVDSLLRAFFRDSDG
jgi:hypothetical protein